MTTQKTADFLAAFAAEMVELREDAKKDAGIDAKTRLNALRATSAARQALTVAGIRLDGASARAALAATKRVGALWPMPLYFQQMLRELEELAESETAREEAPVITRMAA